MLILLLMVGLINSSPLPSTDHQHEITTSEGGDPKETPPASFSSFTPSSSSLQRSSASSDSIQDDQANPKNVRVTSEVRSVSLQINRHHPKYRFLPPPLVFSSKHLSELGLEPTEVEAPGATPTELSTNTGNAYQNTSFVSIQPGLLPVSAYPPPISGMHKDESSSATTFNFADFMIHDEDLQTEISSTSIAKEITVAHNPVKKDEAKDTFSSPLINDYEEREDHLTLDPPEIIEGRSISFDIIKKIVINNDYSQVNNSNPQTEVDKKNVSPEDAGTFDIKDFGVIDDESPVIRIKHFKMFPLKKSEPLISKVVKNFNPVDTSKNTNDYNRKGEVSRARMLNLEEDEIETRNINQHDDKAVEPGPISSSPRDKLPKDSHSVDQMPKVNSDIINIQPSVTVVERETPNEPKMEEVEDNSSSRISRVYFQEGKFEPLKENIKGDHKSPDDLEVQLDKVEEDEAEMIPPVVMASRTFPDDENFQLGKVEEDKPEIIPPVAMASKTLPDEETANPEPLEGPFKEHSGILPGKKVDETSNNDMGDQTALKNLRNQNVFENPESVLENIEPQVKIINLNRTNSEGKIGLAEHHLDHLVPRIDSEEDGLLSTIEPGIITSLPSHTSVVEPLRNKSASRPLGDVTEPTSQKIIDPSGRHSEPLIILTDDDDLTFDHQHQDDLNRPYPKRDSETISPQQHDRVSDSVLVPVSDPVSIPVLDSVSDPLAEEVDKSISSGMIVAIVFGILFFFAIIGGGCYFVHYYRQDIRPKVFSDRSCSNSDSGGYLDDQCRVAYVNSQMEGSQTGTKVGSEDLVSLDNDSFLNSLESMTIQNLWTDSIRHTKL